MPRPHSSARIVQTAPVFSTNWSGQVLTGDTYTGVSGQWVVPTVQPSIDPEYSATWVGLDGTTSPDLIQTGTLQQSLNGTTTYSAWYELLPGSAINILHTVLPGDTMQASVTQTSPGDSTNWTITLQDVTSAWIFSQSFPYSPPGGVPGSSAEWIEEAPSVGGNQSTLANFGSARFTSMVALGTTPASVLTPVYLVDPTGTSIIAYPGTFDSGMKTFTDFFGWPPPVVTSVTPAEGLTQGGSLVAIQGDFIFDATSVTFGTVTAFFVVNQDGSITAISPPGAAGTVHVVVTTPGGASALSVADQFTYLIPAPPPPPPPPPASSPAPQHGYWLVGGDGGIFTFGSAQFFGSTGNLALQRAVVGITPTADRQGYWLVASDGGIFAFGDAGYFGSLPGLGYSPAGAVAPHPLNAPVVGMVPSADGGGYFMVGSDGGVFTFGDARFAGSCPGIGGCAGPAVAVMPDASGNGYWVVTATGAVYSFGDAAYYGGPGNSGSIVTSAVSTPDGHGYWILFANGTVTAFGDAAGLGGPSDPSVGGANRAAAIYSTVDGNGYWVATAGGAVYSFGDAPYDGGMNSVRLNAPVIAATGW